jgi:hypothetical protein
MSQESKVPIKYYLPTLLWMCSLLHQAMQRRQGKDSFLNKLASTTRSFQISHRSEFRLIDIERGFYTLHRFGKSHENY